MLDGNREAKFGEETLVTHGRSRELPFLYLAVMMAWHLRARR
jgi:hypothetical protein